VLLLINQNLNVMSNKGGHGNPFTTKEISTIRNFVKQNPDNLSRAFESAAAEINRSADSISNKWYSSIRGGKKVFHTKSSDKKLSNTKNVFSTKHSTSGKRIEVKNGVLSLGSIQITGDFAIAV